MRILVDESKAGLDPVPHQIGITEQWENLAEASAAIERRLGQQGDEWNVIRATGTPLESVVVEFDVHDPPVETNIVLIDADAYESVLGIPAEGALRFQIQHGGLLEGLALSASGVAGANHRIIRPDRALSWLSDWEEIERTIRGFPVIRAITRAGDRAVQIRAWNVLLGIQGDSRPLIVCEGLAQPMQGPVSVMIDSDEPKAVPYPLLHVPMTILRQVVKEGRSVLVGGELIR